MKPSSVKTLTLIIILTLTAAFGVSGCHGAKQEQPAETLNIGELSTQIVLEPEPVPAVEVPTPMPEPEPGPSPECTTNADCSDGRVCADEKCVVTEPPPPPPPPAIDSDGDGIADESDNCPTIPNENQEDYNANGIADACEIGNFSEDVVCAKHLHWWKIDNYKKWRANPDIYPNVKCTKYVDASKTTSTEDGSEANPFKTIQAAVNIAVAGDVICIKPGVYREHYVDEVNDFPAKDDYTGLFINKIATPSKPIVLAAIGDGEVILDAEYAEILGGSKVKKYRDIGIFINHARYELGIYEFQYRPKFIEIYGLTIQNFKIEGLGQKGCCVRFANNIVRNNGNTIPALNPSAAFLIEYDSNGRIVFGNDGKPKPAPYVLTTDGLDNDNDTLIDETDEYNEQINLGRDAIYESAKSIGNMYVANEMYNNGWYSKKVCADAQDPECPMVPTPCLDAQIAYAYYNLFTCDKVKDILTEGVDKDYKCIDGQAYINFPNKGTATKVLGSPLKDAALGNAWKGIWAGGHGLYTHGSDSLITDNIIHDNGGEGLSLRDYMKNSLVASNKIYNNAAKGIYYISTGRDGKTYPETVNNTITKNEIYNNGVCSSSNLKTGFYLGADNYVISPKGTTISDNYIHDNNGPEFYPEAAWLTNLLELPNCPDDVLKNPALGGCCPKYNTIEKNKFEGVVPIGPINVICAGLVKGADVDFINYLKANNSVVEKKP